jgi:flagellar protein FliO/FliZ
MLPAALTIGSPMDAAARGLMAFFGGMPYPVQFFLAFVIVLGLIGATAWAVRRFGSGRLGRVGTRGRQPRLAVVDYASVDGRRRLILVRRDNVEHLLMIGGPTDVVVESSIVRAGAAAAREVAAPRPSAAAEAPARAISLPEPTATGSWPLQPESGVPDTAPRVARSEPAAGETSPLTAPPRVEGPAAPPRPQRDTLAALADELAIKSAAQSRSRAQPVLRSQPLEPRQLEPRQDAPHELRQEGRQEGRQESRQEIRPEPRQETRPEPRIARGQAAANEPVMSADQSIAEMAHQLEAALRKPSVSAERTEIREPRVAMPRAPSRIEPAAAADADPAAAPAPAVAAPPQGRGSRAGEIRAPRPETKQTNPGKALYDSLEQEMASLLGRPTVKH